MKKCTLGARHKWEFSKNIDVVINRYRVYPVKGLGATKKHGLYKCKCGLEKIGKPK